jgi:protein-S-isoprenylcysteine O-methyltransferase Ste14
VDQPSDSPGVLLPPILLFAGALVLGFVLHWLKPMPVLQPWVARLLGLVLLILSFRLARAAEKVFRRAGTNIRPDQPSLVLLTEGPFRFSRNPLYLATTGMYAAVALIFNALWPLVLLIPMLALLHWGVIRREERYLEAKFGAPYREYRHRVRRWA